MAQAITNTNIITQASAARLRGCSRSRISQLKKDGRFSDVLSASGEVIEGLVYASEVLNFEEGKRGRPRLTPEQLAARKTHPFSVDDDVVWIHSPREAYGFNIIVPATVTKLGTKRIQIRFDRPSGLEDNSMIPVHVWVKTDDLFTLSNFHILPMVEKRVVENEQKASENGGHANP